jgi:hypothetical protein
MQRGQIVRDNYHFQRTLSIASPLSFFKLVFSTPRQYWLAFTMNWVRLLDFKKSISKNLYVSVSTLLFGTIIW